MSKRILLLTHRLPYPPNKGDKIRSFHILEHLSARHEVHLACPIDDVSDLQHIDALRSHVTNLEFARIDGVRARLKRPLALLAGQPISVRAFYSSRLQRQIDQLLERQIFDCVFAYSSPMAEYLFRSRHWSTLLRKCQRWMDFIDVDSAKWNDYAARSAGLAGWIYRREARLLAAYETRIARAFDQLFLVSQAERTALPPGFPAERLLALPNGVDLKYFHVSGESPAWPPRVVFTGVMDYRPNMEGVDWFVREVWPAIRAKNPEAWFDIVGSRPSDRVVALASEPGVRVTGTVPDVRPYVGRASVCVAPLHIARGVQNKVLEAMAMARAVVCTPRSLDGIPAEPGRDLLVADDAREFAEAVNGLLAEPARAARIGIAARDCVERSHRWERTLAPLDELLQ